MEHQTDQFLAISDDGREFLISEYRDVIDAGHLHEPHKTVYGRLRRFETAEGHDVNHLEDGTFQIVELNLIVRKA